MATARDLIQDALEWIGVYAPGETITDADAERCLSKLNDMVDQWSNQSLACYAYLQQSASLVPNVQSYTIGTGGTFNMPRPIRLLTGPGAAYCLDSNNNKYAMAVVTIEEWQMIGNSGSTVTSDFPDTMWYDPQMPLGILNFFPYPSAQGVTAHWTSLLPLTSFTALPTTFTLPPGYKDALQTNLAIKIWPYFKDGSPDGWRVKEAGDALGNVKRTNIRLTPTPYDAALMSRSGNTYSIYIDGPPR